MDIVVFGAGSLGSLVGGLLARTHEVTLVGRDPHVGRVRESGLRVTGELDAHVHPDAVTDGRNLAADLAVVTVKSFDTAAAADTLATGDFDAVLSLQNGLTEELLTDRLDVPVLAGTATYGARLTDPGHVVCTGVGEVVLGALDGGPSPVAERVGDAFRDAGIETLVADDMPRRRWEKLAVNAGINTVTALARVENGALADADAADLAHAAARETARVARAEGVRLPNRAARDAIDTVVEQTAKNRSSMLQDVDAEKRTEVDAISGVVVDRAERHGLDVPTNRTLASLLRAWEAARGLR
ncbi:2-dehydropantoate 2-reductase [Halogranum gelatinilyticum]|uniref:2-dehydropantoate 2-reductase n=1 Tax=Halogranum gelatinilyticum TaxID=660521 RepID=A0A1G9P2H9_9EURY|nr:ketopantoate reductase family protein [Halogranum gelatinilyticum]SDL92365.1 2-dehydropantoate 2-reductase [Halogranum gelatinilyticum]